MDLTVWSHPRDRWKRACTEVIFQTHCNRVRQKLKDTYLRHHPRICATAAEWVVKAVQRGKPDPIWRNPLISAMALSLLVHMLHDQARRGGLPGPRPAAPLGARV